MSRPARAHPVRHGLEQTFGLSRLVVGLGVASALIFSLTLFIAAVAQAYTSIRAVLPHLGEEGQAKKLMIAAVEQADVLLVGMALLIISLGMSSLFIGQVRDLPAWLHIRTFDDLKQKLIGIVIVALAVNFFSVALEWAGGGDILTYGLALAAVILAVGSYSVILSRLGHGSGTGEDGSAAPDDPSP